MALEGDAAGMTKTRDGRTAGEEREKYPASTCERNESWERTAADAFEEQLLLRSLRFFPSFRSLPSLTTTPASFLAQREARRRRFPSSLLLSLQQNPHRQEGW